MFILVIFSLFIMVLLAGIGIHFEWTKEGVAIAIAIGIPVVITIAIIEEFLWQKTYKRNVAYARSAEKQ